MRLDVVDWASRRAPAAVATSLRETGFAVLAGGPVEPDVIECLRAEWSTFFADEAKYGYRADEDARDGYVPFTEADDTAHRDVKEYFHIRLGGRYPAGVPRTALDYLLAGAEAASALLGWVHEHSPPAMTDALPMPLARMPAGGAHSVLRMQHYLPNPASRPMAPVRARAHRDVNLITILPTPSEPGLQVRDAAGGWHDVPFAPGRLIVNTGEVLQLLSGGRYPATLHRVLAPPDTGDRRAVPSRLSFPLFVHPAPDMPVAPGRTAAEFLRARTSQMQRAGWKPAPG